MNQNAKNPSDEIALIADINATFPRANARSLREWANDPAQLGAVISGEALIGDEPIAPYICPDDEAYDGWTHGAFKEWVEARGWYVEVYEPGTLWIVPCAMPAEALA